MHELKARLYGIAALWSNDHDDADTMFRVAALAQGVRLRRVRLRQRAWWRHDQGALLAIRRNDRKMVLLWPDGLSGYHVYHASDGSDQRVDAALASTLMDDAYAVYDRPPPRADNAIEMFADLGSGLVAVLPSIALLAFGAKALEIWQIIAVLFLGAMATAMFDYASRIAAIRHQGANDLQLHSRLWEHIITRPIQALRGAPDVWADRLAQAVVGLRQSALIKPAICRAVFLVIPAVAVLAVTPLGALVGTGLLAVGTACRILLLRRAEAARYSMEICRSARWQQLDQLATTLPQMRLLNTGGWVVAQAKTCLTSLSTASATIGQYIADANVVSRSLDLGVPLLVGSTALLESREILAAAAAALATLPTLRGVHLLADTFGCLLAEARIGPVRPLLEQPPNTYPCPIRLDRVDSLVFDHVTFTYPGSSAPCLRDVNLTLQRGQVLAVAGPSGSGKSTVLMLALGLVQPQSGGGFVNQADLSRLDAEAFRARIGAVFQDEQIGVATIHSVILGMAPLPAERAWQAARLARLDHDIAALPMGMQTLVAEGSFPTGLIQRLLIARALARKPDLLVLDEATAALDDAIQAALFADLRGLGTAVLVASHRPSTIQFADHVLYLSEPVEVGLCG